MLPQSAGESSTRGAGEVNEPLAMPSGDTIVADREALEVFEHHREAGDLGIELGLREQHRGAGRGRAGSERERENSGSHQRPQSARAGHRVLLNLVRRGTSAAAPTPSRRKYMSGVSPAPARAV